jgi:uncharacterized membrane protein YfcA
MAKYVGTAVGDGTYTLAATADDGILDSILGAFTAPLLEAGSFMDASGVFWACFVWLALGLVIGGYIGRRRAEAVSPAIAKFLF